jgi:signal transduction histidine kinase
MDNLRRTRGQLFRSTFYLSAVLHTLLVLAIYGAYRSGADINMLLVAAIIAAIAITLVTAWVTSGRSTKLLTAITQAILHVSPSEHGIPAPQIEELRIGRAFVTDLVHQIHELADIPRNAAMVTHQREATQASIILSHLPLPVFVFNNEQRVTFASDVALEYTDSNSAQLFGEQLSEAIDMEFSSDFTLTSWIADCQANKATDTAYWRRVRIRSKTNPDYQKQCDIAGSYSRDNSQGVEFVITLFDHTEEYDQDDQSMNFVALAVHELRTPLTVMRGYIEAFEDELDGKLDETTTQYMDRLQASAKQLAAFVNNILNVARIQENQLAVKLAEENWAEVVNMVVTDMSIQARTRGKRITVDIANDLPTVGADRTTIYEVLCNLIDNAIKYSGKSEEIIIRSRLTQDNFVETSVEDKGVGIPASVLPTLFEKFHRNHRNRLQISGTGLGLYISKAIIEAHEGSIWVNSQEGQGSTFSFTVLPYASLAANQKAGDNTGMTRTAHGWIKNHTMYRK